MIPIEKQVVHLRAIWKIVELRLSGKEI